MVAVFVDIEQLLVLCHETWQPISIFSLIDVQLGYPDSFVRLQHCDPPSKIIPPWVLFESNERQWVGFFCKDCKTDGYKRVIIFRVVLWQDTFTSIIEFSTW